MTRTLLPAASLAKREIVRFLRQRSRVVSAIAQPAMFLALFGAGFHGSFRTDGAVAGEGVAVGFAQFMYAGTVVLVVLFSAIFSSFSVIEDRNAGFMQSVLAAPVSRAGIALGKIGGGAAMALLQGAVLLAFAPLLVDGFTAASFASGFAALVPAALGLAALGVALAWRMESTQGFHAVMMLLLMPMWLLSGAFFPLGDVPSWLDSAMRLNPLTYDVALLRHAIGDPTAASAATPSFALSLGVSVGFALAAFAAATAVVARKERS